MSFFVKLGSAASGAALLLSASVAQAEVLIWSTQAKPVEEAQAMRENVLAGAGDVDLDFDGGACFRGEC